MTGLKGPAPHTMDAGAWRAKQIQYASRTPHDIDALASKINLRHTMRLLEDPGAGRSQDRFDVVHIVYQAATTVLTSTDFAGGGMALDIARADDEPSPR
jgi:hypothetical protein